MIRKCLSLALVAVATIVPGTLAFADETEEPMAGCEDAMSSVISDCIEASDEMLDNCYQGWLGCTAPWCGFMCHWYCDSFYSNCLASVPTAGDCTERGVYTYQMCMTIALTGQQSSPPLNYPIPGATPLANPTAVVVASPYPQQY